MDNRESRALAEKVQKILRREPAIIGYYKEEKCLKENLKNASK
jgi:hypothetical protein